MSNAERFGELLRSDEGLQAKAREALGAFGGDRSDERAVFDAVVAPLAEEAGLPFTYDEARSAAEGEGEVDLAEADAATGGFDGLCFIVGGTNGQQKEICGQDYESTNKDGGMFYCDYVGIGGLWT